MPKKKQVQTRIPSDVNEELEAYKAERNLSQADAVRRLIRVGLAAEGHPVTNAEGKSFSARHSDEEAQTWAERAQRLFSMAKISGGVGVVAFVLLLLQVTWNTLAPSSMWVAGADLAFAGAFTALFVVTAVLALGLGVVFRLRVEVHRATQVGLSPSFDLTRGKA